MADGASRGDVGLSNPDPSNPDHAGPSASGVLFLILSQIATKGFTFVLNQLLVRNISPEIFGIASYLEFLVSSVLFFSREAERMAIQRAYSGSKDSLRQKIVNFAYIPLGLGAPIAALMYLMQRKSALFSENITTLPYSGVTFALIIALVFVELVAEPLFALNQYQLNFRARSKIESFAVFSKCIVTFGGVLISKRLASGHTFDGLAVASFALGQVAYSFSTLAGYFWASSFEVSKVCKIEEDNEIFYFDRKISKIWRSLFVQMIFKHLLTEGDTLVISFLFSVGEQGVYSVISNYGSILARLLFQPIEESLRVSFTRAFAGKHPNMAGSYRLMENLIVFYLNLSLLIALGGFTNGAFLLRLLLGNNEKWQNSSVFEYFPQYLLYLPFMAFNGILEAFFSSASNQNEIKRFSVFMSVLSVAVLALLYLFVGRLKMGLSGLILANVVNMALRIVYCFSFFLGFFQRKGVSVRVASLLKRASVPLLAAVTTFGAQYVVLGGYETNTFLQFIQSGILCVGCLFVMLVNERQALKTPLLKLVGKRKTE